MFNFIIDIKTREGLKNNIFPINLEIKRKGEGVHVFHHDKL